MKRASHRYILPGYLLGLHAVLLLPVLLGDSSPPARDGDRYANGTTAAGAAADRTRESRWERLHVGYALPLALAAFLIIHYTKKLLGFIPLPTDERRARLAWWIENAVLFGSGCLEELWRWGVVRVLVHLLGGSGGWGGRGALWATSAPPGPSLWEAVYLLGWTWSLVEASFSWWALRPLPTDPPLTSAPATPTGSPLLPPRSPTIRILDDDELDLASPRRPLLGKRNRSDYSLFQDVESAVDPRSSYGSIGRHKKPTLSHPPRPSPDTLPAHATIKFAAGPHSRTVSPLASRPTSPGSRAATPPAPRPASPSSSSASSSLSFTSTATNPPTPLLSSSLPYNPLLPHPHLSTTNLSDTLHSPFASPPGSPAPPTTPPSPLISVHENDPPPAADPPTTPRRRLYPSFPSYSVAYNDGYFPAPSAPQTPFPAQPVTVYIPRTVYGHALHSLPVYLPAIWRTSAATRHVANALLMAWVPGLVWALRNGAGAWTLGVVAALAVKKGWNSIEFFGGVAQRRGLRRASVGTLAGNALVLAGALWVWGVI